MQHPWNQKEPLVVAVGEWDSDHCGLPSQWAKAVFDVTQDGKKFIGTLIALLPLCPEQPDTLADVHLVESDLAELSGLWTSTIRYSWQRGLERWYARSVGRRCELIAAGFRSWRDHVGSLPY